MINISSIRIAMRLTLYAEGGAAMTVIDGEKQSELLLKY